MNKKTTIFYNIDKQLLLFSVKMLIFRAFLTIKKKWQFLVKTAILNNGFKRYKIIFLIGLFDFFASVPMSLIAILPITFGTLFYILDKCKNEKYKSQLAIIFFFLFGHFVGIFWWMFVPLTTELTRFFWLIPFAILGIPFLITMLFMPFFTFSVMIWNKFYKNKKYATLYFAGLFLISWFLGDYIRGHYIFGGFPWMLFGHFMTYSFALQSIRYFGLDFYSIFILSLTLVPYFWIFKKSVFSRKICIFILGAFCLNCLFGFAYIFATKEKILNVNIAGSQINQKATLNIGPDEEYVAMGKRLKQLSWLSKSSRPTIMLFPEAVITFPIYSGDEFVNAISRIVPNDNSLLLMGGLYYDGVSPYNSIYSITKYGDIIAIYKKQKLVPFGEYIPFRKYFPFLTRAITGGMIDFGTGENNNYFTFYRNLPYIYPIVCYESIFPQFVKENIYKSRQFISSIDDDYRKQNNIKTIKENGELIVNLTNDAWMKWSVAGYQHFLMTRFLAIITNIPVVRVSNNGISAYIDNFGRVKRKTKFNEEDILFVKASNK